jgi:hypothetical protein
MMVDDRLSLDKDRWKLICLYRQAARPRDIATLLSELGGGRLNGSAQCVLLEGLSQTPLPAQERQHDAYEG